MECQSRGWFVRSWKLSRATQRGGQSRWCLSRVLQPRFRECDAVRRVNKHPRLTPPLLCRSIAWLADRRRDPTPTNKREQRTRERERAKEEAARQKERDLSEMGHSSGGSGKSALGWFLIPSTEIISGLTPDR